MWLFTDLSAILTETGCSYTVIEKEDQSAPKIWMPRRNVLLSAHHDINFIQTWNSSTPRRISSPPTAIGQPLPSVDSRTEAPRLKATLDLSRFRSSVTCTFRHSQQTNTRKCVDQQQNVYFYVHVYLFQVFCYV